MQLVQSSLNVVSTSSTTINELELLADNYDVAWEMLNKEYKNADEVKGILIDKFSITILMFLSKN